MKIEKLSQAVAIAQKTKLVFIATADPAGIPHLACAGKMTVEDNRLAVTEWFCPGTVANLFENKNISIVVWDKSRDTGFQIIGQVQRVEDMAVLDGYAPAAEKHPLPQVERKIVVEVDKILDFRLGPHSDLEE